MKDLLPQRFPALKARQQDRFHIESGEILLLRKCCKPDEKPSHFKINPTFTSPHSTHARGIFAIVARTAGSTQLLPIAQHAEPS
jgi:hypothetical protein